MGTISPKQRPEPEHQIPLPTEDYFCPRVAGAQILMPEPPCPQKPEP